MKMLYWSKGLEEKSESALQIFGGPAPKGEEQNSQSP